MNVFIRGAKYSNKVANASRSLRAATASMRDGHLAASDAALLAVSFSMRLEGSQVPTNVRREYRIGRELARAAIRRGNRESGCIQVKTHHRPVWISTVIQIGVGLVLIVG